MRGYDYAGVDTFLATLRSDVADLQERYEAAQQRLQELEAGGGGGGATPETEGELRRTLVLAQRLADETEADAKASAEQMITAATEHADTTRAEAEAEAAQMRETAEQELANANEEADAIRQQTAEESEQASAKARERAEILLSNAEQAGTERVVEIEGLAQAEVAEMREPIRTEVEQLEGVRSQLLNDISDLESHLEAQRVRVRNAVDALRVGMSGSIEDLQRVAEDDALMAPQPAPDHSDATAADVAAAPPIEIQEAVAENAAPTTPSVDGLSAEPAEVDELTAEPAEVDELTAEPADAGDGPQHAVGASEGGDDTQPIPVVDATAVDEDDAISVDEAPVLEEAAAVEEADLVHDDVPLIEQAAAPEETAVVDDVPVEASEVEEMPAAVVHDADMASAAEMVDDGSNAGLGIAAAGVAAGAGAVAMHDGGVEAVATAEELEEAELVLLDAEPDPMFGTDLGADAEVVEAADTSAPADIATDSAGFVARFASALDELPIDQ